MCSFGGSITVGSRQTTSPIYRPGIAMQDVTETFGASGPYQSDGDKRDTCCLMGLGSYCGRTAEQKLEEAKRKFETRQYFLGITKYGYQEPILEAINLDPKYRDANTGKPVYDNFKPKPDPQGRIDYDKVAENYRSLDCYSGLADGRNYGSLNRLRQHKLRNTRNPNGTETRFCIPIANSMHYGWWKRDLDCLNKTDWYKPRVRFPTVRGDVTKFVDEMNKHDPNFIMF